MCNSFLRFWFWIPSRCSSLVLHNSNSFVMCETRSARDRQSQIAEISACLLLTCWWSFLVRAMVSETTGRVAWILCSWTLTTNQLYTNLPQMGSRTFGLHRTTQRLIHRWSRSSRWSKCLQSSLRLWHPGPGSRTCRQWTCFSVVIINMWM